MAEHISKDSARSYFRPRKGDRVRVVLEGEVRSGPTAPVFWIGHEGESNAIQPHADHVVSVEKIEGNSGTPAGSTGNTCGCAEHCPPPVEVFKAGDLVRNKKTGTLRALSCEGYVVLHPFGEMHRYSSSRGGFARSEFTSEKYEKVEIPSAH